MKMMVFICKKRFGNFSKNGCHVGTSNLEEDKFHVRKYEKNVKIHINCIKAQVIYLSSQKPIFNKKNVVFFYFSLKCI